MSGRTPGRRVVVAGFGDSGLLTAVHLRGHADIVGISAKPGLVSGQELGRRLSRPEEWAREYWVAFERFRGLDGVRTVHGVLISADLAARTVTVSCESGPVTEPYDVLVIATGVTNGFWRRRPLLQSDDDVAADLRAAHERLAGAPSVAVIGGGAAAVSAAYNVATVWPDKRVDLYFPGERPLPRHHGRVWAQVGRRLAALGVGLHAGRRAVVPPGFECDAITEGTVSFVDGGPPARADAVVWAIGRVRPNTGWLPPGVLDDAGFVRVTPTLQLPEHPEVFAVGDVAATDPLRSSARNRADKMLAHNVRAYVDGGRMREFRAPRRRWGSVVGPQPEGHDIFGPGGRMFRFPGWTVGTVLQPWIVQRGIYRGIRKPSPGGSLTPSHRD